jgi:hypothetical protein
MKKRVGLLMAITSLLILFPACAGSENLFPKENILTCGKEIAVIPTYLDVIVVSQPVGGDNINNLICIYEVTYRYSGEQASDGRWYTSDGKEAYPPQEIKLNLAWINDKGGEHNSQTLIFSTSPIDNKSGVYTTTLQPQVAGQFFDKTFWVDFSWRDSNGLHNLVSSKAVCQVR